MGGNPRTIPGGFTQANFNISEELLYKVRYIVLNDQRYKSNSEIYNESIEGFVEKWEKQNGKIKNKAYKP
jgi:hypothetical protein